MSDILWLDLIQGKFIVKTITILGKNCKILIGFIFK